MTTGARIDRRIHFYAGKLEKSPRLHPVHAQLAAAYLDKAQLTRYPRWLDEARAALARSIAIQPTYFAFKTMARAANLDHRFDEALRWGTRALDGRPTAADPELVAILVEAHLGRGEHARARALLPPEETAPADFYTASAMAAWLSSQQRFDEAAHAFHATAGFARSLGELEATTWAESMAADARARSARVVTGMRRSGRKSGP